MLEDCTGNKLQTVPTNRGSEYLRVEKGNTSTMRKATPALCTLL